MASVKDVIKESVLKGLGGDNLSIRTIAFILVISMIIGIYIFEVYKHSCKSSFYSRDLNITMAGMPIVVAAIMIAMQSNLIVSLGMVGALSIIRFRNAVKNPLDLLFLFWSMSAGIICGVGLGSLACILCVVMTAVILILQRVPNIKGKSILVLRVTNNKPTEKEILNVITMFSKHVSRKSKNIYNGEWEYIFELITKQDDKLIGGLEKMGITNVKLIDYDGEYRE